MPSRGGSSGSSLPNKLIIPGVSATPPAVSNTPKPAQPAQKGRVADGPIPTFQKGDRVSHARFGEGTVEQVIGHGEKTIYNIQFDRVTGKKLIDPRFAKLDRA
jgi:DNA helicase-2/ATP-dependent DNA helicase PcrA